MTLPRFDSLAPHYAWIEALTFGGFLHWCRTALLAEVTEAERVLILGEGDGRFLKDFLAMNSKAVVDVVDASAAMVGLARQRIELIEGATDRVNWHLIDARLFEVHDRYDLIVTNFFLDCFPDEQLESLVVRLASRLKPRGSWLIGDFALPDRPILRFPARIALAAMYAFFKVVTGIPALWLADPRPILERQGLKVVCEKRRLGGFLVARLWKKVNLELI